MKLKKPGEAKFKVVLDTSVYVAALLSKTGASTAVFEQVLSGKVFNFYTEEIFDETKEVFSREKFKVDKDKQEHFLNLIRGSSSLVTLFEQFKVTKSRDPEDDVFLSLANQTEADYLVTLDEDLLVLKKFSKTEILRPSEFLIKFRAQKTVPDANA